MEQNNQNDDSKRNPTEQSEGADQPLLYDVNGLTGESKKNYDEYMELLNKYEQDDHLTHADIYHLYPQEIAFPDGYHDSRFFNLVAYNTKISRPARISNKNIHA